MRIDCLIINHSDPFSPDGRGHYYVTITFKDANGIDIEETISSDIVVKLKDAERNVQGESPIFFGDRSLSAPGYSSFGLDAEEGDQLKGTVGYGSYNNKPLDVYRVEQRLKYFGYTAFGRNVIAEGTSLSANPRIPKEFNVDGIFGKEEESALRAFYAATQLDFTPNRTPSTKSIWDFNWGIEDATDTWERAVFSDNLLWLNAYNAPHWMNIYDSFGIPHATNSNGTVIRGSTADFKDGTSVTFEIYGTSWTRDLLRAWQWSSFELPTGLLTEKLQLNGLTDPGYGVKNSRNKTVHNTGNHSIGMGLDLGVGPWISDFNQNNVISDPDNPRYNNPDIGTIPKDGWSVAKAVEWSDKLPDTFTTSTKNNQQRALSDFLALYALTRSDNISDGTGDWDDLLIANGANTDEKKQIRSALFGDRKSVV